MKKRLYVLVSSSLFDGALSKHGIYSAGEAFRAIVGDIRCGMRIERIKLLLIPVVEGGKK